MSSRGRRRGGFTLTQLLRPGQMYDNQTAQTRPPAVSQSVDSRRDQIRDQLPPVLDILADSLSDLKSTNFGILHFGILEIHGLCELGP
jgi:hypothetical protein